MHTSKCVTTKLENKIRKHWIFSTLFILVFYPLVGLAISAIFSDSSSLKEALVDCPVRVIIGTIQAIFLWHCTYKNYGTKLLSFYLVSLPLLLIIAMLIPLVDSESAGTTAASNSGDASNITISLIGLSGFFWWLVLSLKMKDVNKAAQERVLGEKLSKSTT